MRKLTIITSLLVLTATFTNCEKPDSREIVRTAESFIDSLMKSDTEGLVRVAPWFAHADEKKAAGLFAIAKGISGWKIESVTDGMDSAYVSVLLDSDAGRTSLVLPVKKQDGAWIVLERIRTSVHIDFVPLSPTPGT